MVHQTTYVPKQTNHLLHLLLTLGTCGMWAPVWAVMVIINMVTKDKHTTTTTGGWYAPVARPYEVGPGAPVSAMNPLPPPPPVGYPPTPPYVGYGGGPTGMTRKPYTVGMGQSPTYQYDGTYCHHGQHRSLYCEPCGNEAMDNPPAPPQ